MKRSLVLVIAFGAIAAAPTAHAAAKCMKPYSWVAGATNLCRGAVVYGDCV